MKARPFRYCRPNSLDDAYRLLNSEQDAARVLAGGQSLVPMMNLRLAVPEVLLDIGGLTDLAGITVANDTLRIGATTRYFEIERSPLVAQHAPLIAAAIPHVAHLAVRNRGTFGGSLALADPAAEMPACVLALDGTIIAGSHDGIRRIAASDFFRGLYVTALKADEILLAVDIPTARPRDRFAFEEFSRRHGDFAVAGITMKAHGQKSGIADARIAAFGISDRPVLLPTAAALVSGPGRRPALADLKSAIDDDVQINDDIHYSRDMRRHLASVLIDRCLEAMSARADLVGE